MGTVEDIAFMAVYLASDVGSFINGTVIVVDGGATLWRPELVTEEQLKQITAVIRKKEDPKKSAL